MLLGDGFGNFSAPTVIPVGAPGGSLVLPAVRAADLDGDLILDLAVTNLPASTVSILIGNPAGGGGTGFVGPAGDFSTLFQNPDGTFTRTLKDGTRIEFDAAGLQTAVIDRNGNTTSYAYDGQGRLTTITDPKGLVTTLTYSGDRLASVTDPALRVTSFVHDGDGNLTSITDPDLSLRQFAYDARHRMTSQTSKRNFATSYDYNFAGRQIQSNWPDGSTRKVSPSQTVGVIDTTGGAGAEANPAPYVRPNEVVATFTDGNGNVTTYTLNRFGSATQSIDALGRTTDTVRNADSQMTSITEAVGTPEARTTSFTYDAKGNVLTRTEAVGDPLERVTTFTYEPTFNRLKTATDPAGKVKTIDYDANGNPLTITDPLLGTRIFTYDPQGLVLTRTDENSKTTTFTYDAKGNVDTATDAENNATSFVRDTAGNITSITEGVGTPEERIISLTYDALNRLLTTTDGTLAVTQFRFDAAGNLQEIENATGEIQFRSYDELDRLTVVDDPITGINQLTLDLNGNVKTQTDALIKITTLDYDVVNRLTKTIDPLLGETILTYDVIDNLKTVTDPRNQTTSFDYDLLNRLIKRTNPLGQFTTFTFDSRDNLITTTDAKTQLITRFYDDLSRLIQMSTPDNVIDATYDGAGNVLTVTDNDSSLSFTYDGNNQGLTASTVTGGVQPVITLTGTFDAIRNRTQLSDSLGGVTQFGYDAAKRLIQLITPANDTIGLAHDAAGRPDLITFPNTLNTDFQYDLQGRLSDLIHIRGITELARFGYIYNAVGNILSVTELAQTRNFSYDDLQRLTSGGTVAAPESYTYDGIGNRTASHLSASHITNAANRLTEDDDFTYTYDANGNLETKTDKITLAVTSYNYNAQDQLTGIDFPDLTTASYRYDGFRRRIEKNVAGVITRYVYDGEDIVMEFDGANTLAARYSHGDGRDQPLSTERGGQSFFYQADHQGSVTQITDAAGFVVNTYEYDSYGRIEASIEGIANPFTYTAREFDAESGLYFYRARYYDAETGRFLNQDPIGFAAGDANLYRYVFNNPVNLTDPDGEIAISGTIIAIGTGIRIGVSACRANPACVAAAIRAAITATRFVIDVARTTVTIIDIIVMSEPTDEAAEEEKAAETTAGEKPCDVNDPGEDDDEAKRKKPTREAVRKAVEDEIERQTGKKPPRDLKEEKIQPDPLPKEPPPVETILDLIKMLIG